MKFTTQLLVALMSPLRTKRVCYCSEQISQKQDGCNIYAIMKTMCPPGCHHNGFCGDSRSKRTWSKTYNPHEVNVHHVPKCMSCHKAIAVITGRAHCFNNWIYIYRYIDIFQNSKKHFLKLFDVRLHQSILFTIHLKMFLLYFIVIFTIILSLL